MKPSKVIKKIYIKSNYNFSSKKVYHTLIDKLLKNGFEIMPKFDDSCDMVISIGGDGSFLKIVHELQYPKCIFTGINTGHLGFFQDALPSEIDNLINCIKTSNYEIQNIIPLKAIVTTGFRNFELHSINEFAIKGYKNKTVHINLSIDGNHIESFSGDGVIISSSTGSTAYNYSASGSIIDPRLNIIQVTPIAPLNSNAYRSLTSSIVLPFKSKVKITPENQYQNTTLFLADAIQFKYEKIQDIEISYSDYKIHLLRLEKYRFWKKVKEKFL
jgi:probable inorganic polyphosphate/ATP-NAD kinase